MVTINYRLGVLGFLCLGSDLVNMQQQKLQSLDLRFLAMLVCETKLWLFTG